MTRTLPGGRLNSTARSSRTPLIGGPSRVFHVKHDGGGDAYEREAAGQDRRGQGTWAREEATGDPLVVAGGYHGDSLQPLAPPRLGQRFEFRTLQVGRYAGHHRSSNGVVLRVIPDRFYEVVRQPADLCDPQATRIFAQINAAAIHRRYLHRRFQAQPQGLRKIAHLTQRQKQLVLSTQQIFRQKIGRGGSARSRA